MNSDELLRENQALRKRLSRLGQASLGLAEDLGTQRRAARDGGRGPLAGRGQDAGITTLDERGQLWEFVTSGLTPEERRLAQELPGGSSPAVWRERTTRY